ncbi:hypothetical protein DPMN_134554 [Dreissena polymorpha]|uniref:Uncharacterized protein n=1 Tax=Dreissena polymorpha TaxID=45954 RepID=A0A9D4G0B1_DREPO|nr:hypothetical protein DPMN_134554 [Dreissena polymorpha]
MTSTRGDDVLRLSDSSDTEFSGFDIVDTPYVAQTIDACTDDVCTEKRHKSLVKGKKIVKSF